MRLIDADELKKDFNLNFGWIRHAAATEIITGGAWELPAEELELQVNYKGVQATALRCTNGELLFYDSRMAAPVSDVMRDSEYVQTVIRKRRSGQRVIVIKDGFEAIAAIMPMKVINSAFLKALSELDSACVEQYERESKAGLAAQEEQENG